MPRHRNRNIFKGISHTLGVFFSDPLGNIAHSVGSAVKDVGHAVGGVVHDVIGGAASGLSPLVKQVGTSATGVLKGGIQPVLKTAGEAVATDLTALASPLQALQLPLMIGAGAVAIFLIMKTMN